jgi:phage repressor protein C with HTH and peptisase S24 domain
MVKRNILILQLLRSVNTLLFRPFALVNDIAFLLQYENITGTYTQSCAPASEKGSNSYFSFASPRLSVQTLDFAGNDGESMRHKDVWRAIDTLAAENGLSPSGLARKAGLDPTSFNLSKRRTADGRSRWPSTESLSKVLDATGAALEDFTALVTGARAMPDARGRARTKIPLIGLAQAGSAGFFDDGGYPAGAGWDEVELPATNDPNAYALGITGDSMEPVYRDGDSIVVSPAAPIRVGDRVVARDNDGAIMAKMLTKRTASRIELTSLNPNYPPLTYATTDITWLHRIIWASQ